MPIITREECYFEPRVIGSNGKIRWYGEEYSSKKTEEKAEYTVYIRDTGSHLLVYELYSDDEMDERFNKISCTFFLIDRIEKYSDKFVYGRIRR